MNANQQRKRAQIAELLLGCCEAVYLPDDRPGFIQFCGERSLRSQIISAGNARAAVFSNADSIIACIAGTNDSKDWKNNLSFRKRAYLGGNVSSGFGAHFGLIRKPLVKAIHDEFNRNPRPIYIAGHSLGGAVVYFLAMVLTAAGIPWEMGVVAGAPRPGDAAFAEAFENSCADKWIQLRNRADAVPCLPPYLLGYRHPECGVAVINLLGNIKRSMSPFWQFSQRAARVARAHLSFSGVRLGRVVSRDDHSISAYRQAVSKTLDSLDPKATDWAS